MISNGAAYGAAIQAQVAGQPTLPDQGQSQAYGAITALPTNYGTFTPATTRAPVIPANSPVIIQPTMPQGTPLSMPSVVATATTYLPANNGGLQPSDLLHPLPSIVNTAPVQVPAPCSNSIEQWVSANPMLAVIGLGALAWYVFGKK